MATFFVVRPAHVGSASSCLTKGADASKSAAVISRDGVEPRRTMRCQRQGLRRGLWPTSSGVAVSARPLILGREISRCDRRRVAFSVTLHEREQGADRFWIPLNGGVMNEAAKDEFLRRNLVSAAVLLDRDSQRQPDGPSETIADQISRALAMRIIEQ